MNHELILKPIAYIHNDYTDTFGIPRQSGLVNGLISKIIFEPDYRYPDAIRGLEDYSHLWLIWGFSKNKKNTWSPTVRPPRLGGNTRMGVFATRSPFRPNPIGLSSVKLHHIEFSESHGPILYIQGADLMDQTPIYDIKPYLTYADSHPEACEGFAGPVKNHHLDVHIPKHLLDELPKELQPSLVEMLAQDPRPSYQKDPDRIYGFKFSNYEIQFKVCESVLTVGNISKIR